MWLRAWRESEFSGSLFPGRVAIRLGGYNNLTLCGTPPPPSANLGFVYEPSVIQGRHIALSGAEITTIADINHAPALAPVSDQTLTAGQTLVVTNAATDPEVPPQTLTFSLLEGPRGFLRVVSLMQLAFADYRGNRQMLSTGNLAANDLVALFLMDYPRRESLKILGHARVEDARQHPEFVAQLAEPEGRRIVERLFFIEVISFDWNCPKYITPRYTAAEVEKAVEPLRQRIAELEAQLKVQN